MTVLEITLEGQTTKVLLSASVALEQLPECIKAFGKDNVRTYEEGVQERSRAKARYNVLSRAKRMR